MEKKVKPLVVTGVGVVGTEGVGRGEIGGRRSKIQDSYKINKYQ